MKFDIPRKAILLLEDGSEYHGYALGATGISVGEVCFNTGMTGYQEIYTDPSYYGQIIVNTSTHIGNYGVHELEAESDGIKFAGLVCDTFSAIYSRSSAFGSLNQYLERAGISGIYNVDTRSIVRLIRNKGAMNALICTDGTNIDALKATLNNTPQMLNLELATQVSVKAPYFLGNPEQHPIKVAVIDYGIKRGILNNLTHRGMLCKVFPATTTFEEMEEWSPKAYFLSNGPGDPAAMDYAVQTIKNILATNKPVFGICLGHQLLALAVGLRTYKMHHGHRGLNHPVLNLRTGLSEVTSQNHGFAVEAPQQTLDNIEITHINLNDNTVEGLRLTNKKAFSVQYHPEACPGPHDSNYLFDEFKSLIINA